MNLCALCLLSVQIFTSPEGECLRIEVNSNSYPCTDEVKADTGCWDEEGNTQLCGASWIAVDNY